VRVVFIGWLPRKTAAERNEKLSTLGVRFQHRFRGFICHILDDTLASDPFEAGSAI
jgi:hypothetical protein